MPAAAKCQVAAETKLCQVQVALKLSKADPGELHAFWVVCSMLTQADMRRAGVNWLSFIDTHAQQAEGHTEPGFVLPQTTTADV